MEKLIILVSSYKAVSYLKSVNLIGSFMVFYLLIYNDDRCAVLETENDS